MLVREGTREKENKMIQEMKKNKKEKVGKRETLRIKEQNVLWNLGGNSFCGCMNRHGYFGRG